MTLTRRDALRSTAFASAAAFLPAARAAVSPLPPQRFHHLGLASYSLRLFDAARVIAEMKRLHTPFLNVKDAHLKMGTPAEVAVQAAILRDGGLTLTGAGNVTFAKNDIDDMRPKFEYIKAAGIHVMVCAPQKAMLPNLEKLVREYDIRLAIHNHGPEDKNFPSPLDVLEAVKPFDKRIGCCIDVGHTTRAGVDPATAIRKCGPRVLDIHVKDLADGKTKGTDCAVGTGVLPIRDIFQALADIRYGGFVDLEYEATPQDPFAGIEQSFAFMRGLISGMNLVQPDMDPNLPF